MFLLDSYPSFLPQDVCHQCNAELDSVTSIVKESLQEKVRHASPVVKKTHSDKKIVFCARVAQYRRKGENPYSHIKYKNYSHRKNNFFVEDLLQDNLDLHLQKSLPHVFWLFLNL